MSIFKRMTSWRWWVTFIVLLPLMIIVEMPRHIMQFFTLFFATIAEFFNLLESIIYRFSCWVGKKIHINDLRRWWMNDLEKRTK